MEIIKTTNLTKYYGKSRGIIDLNLTVTQGEFFGFIGPNGAGKSTTIRTLLGLISPTSGNAMIFGKNVAQKKESILQDIGYLPSEALFYPGMKVKDLLKLSADLRNRTHRYGSSRQKKNCCRTEYFFSMRQQRFIFFYKDFHRPFLFLRQSPKENQAEVWWGAPVQFT